MITVKLLGGLGNQMFQYAFALALKSKGYQIRLDKSSMVEGTHREYSLSYFGVKAVEDNPLPRMYEKGMRFNPENLQPSDPCTMIGYWQSEKYFADIANQVHGAFRFQDPYTVQFGPNIAVHVRRQDYVNLQQFHGLQTLDYYREGVAYIRRKAGLLLNVLVFSDDPQWCKENFPGDFTIVESNSKYEDLKLMSACDYAVIANSSFSWWGAWLSRQRMVIAPKQWFTDPMMDYTDIVPERWVKL